jgi:regulator of nucleoside diphosphate kinase
MNRVIIPSEDFVALRQLGCDKLEAELDRADVLLAAEVPDDVVTMYSRVRYLDETTGERRSVTLVYPDETDVERGRISVLAPVGSALLGLSEGQSIDWEFPRGARRRLRVEEVVRSREGMRRDTQYPLRSASKPG